MRRIIYAGLALLTVVTMVHAQAAAPAEKTRADRVALIRPAPIHDRVARAESIVTGKVTSIEDKTVAAPAFPGAQDKIEYLIAVVKIDDAVLGAKGLTHVKVGFPAPQAGGVGKPIPRLGRGQATLEKDQEVLLFLAPHHTGEFQIMEAYFDVVDKKADTFEKDLAAAKKYAKLLAEPEKGLKSKDAEERLTTAAMLIARYRTPRPSAKQPKQEPIDAEQSKLILNTLAEADWTPPKPGGPNVNYDLNPLNLFFRLNLEEKDGWKPPMDGNKFPEAAQAWLKENKDKYGIKKFVAEMDEKKDK